MAYNYKVPQLKDYSGAIQANQSMTSAFGDLNDISQGHLNYVAQNKKDAADIAYKNDVLANTKNQNEIDNAFKQNTQDLAKTKYTNELSEKNDIKSANIASFSSLFPDEAAKIKSSYGDIPSIENADKLNNVMGNIDLSNFEKNKTFNYTKGQDEINNNFKKQEIAIKKHNAYKPPAQTQADKLLAIMMGQQFPTAMPTTMPTQNTQTPNNNTAPATNTTASVNPATPQKETPLLEVGSANKPMTKVDIASQSKNITITDANGYKYSQNPITGRKVLISKPTVTEQIKEQQLKNEQSDEIVSLKNTVTNSNNMINRIDGVANNKNLGWATGLASPLASIPGTDAYDVSAELETIKGGAFTQAIGALKGLGAMSEMEGKKVTDAIANLDLGQSTDKVKRDLNAVKAMMQNAIDNANAKLKNRNVEVDVKTEISDEELMKALKGGN